MPLKNTQLTITYTAWDALNCIGQTGDAGNHTLNVTTDGSTAAATNAPSEVSNGEYKLTLTADEMDGAFIVLSGSSSTDNVVIVPVRMSTHDVTAARAGYLDKLNVSGVLAHADNADLFKADVSAIADKLNVSGALAHADNADLFKADVSAIADKLNVSGALAHADNADLFKADVSAIDAEATADKVWDEVSGEHDTPGTMGALQALLQRLGGVAIRVTAPVAADQGITIVQGNDYATADGRALVWTNEAYTGPDLAGATVTFRAIPRADYDKATGQAALEQAGTITVVDSQVTVTVELTSAQTSLLTQTFEAAYKYELEITLLSGRIFTYVLADLTVLSDVTEQS